MKGLRQNSTEMLKTERNILSFQEKWVSHGLTDFTGSPSLCLGLSALSTSLSLNTHTHTHTHTHTQIQNNPNQDTLARQIGRRK